jgi:hypothetical protein
MHSINVKTLLKKTFSNNEEEVGIMEVSKSIEFCRYFANKKGH